MPTHILGIRHHGPGSARHTVAALQQLKPDIILIEGPQEAEAILSWANHAQMKPPVAILAYVPDNPNQALIYPFAEYSPEWQAIQYGLQHNIAVRFADMPLTHKLALQEEQHHAFDVDENAAHEDDNQSSKSSEDFEENASVYKNPVRYLAEIAGFSDEEQWWEQHFELSQEDPLLLFETVKNAMGALREELPQTNKINDLQREVFMRKALHQAQNEMFETIVFVCGAWHAPMLEKTFKQKDEKELIKNLPKVKVDSTWIPWTNDRLMFESGYGAGIESPGWYAHQWKRPDDDGTYWLTKTARIFRKEKIDISSAHVIEAVRLAHALCDMRNLNKASLYEMQEATQTVMLMGDALPMKLLKKDLYVGNEMGEIPEDAPKSPLQLDFEKQLKSLRLKVTEGEQVITLDLRKPLDLQKSIFLNRLNLLEINWGNIVGVSSKGTFKEQWSLYWQPQMMIELIAKSSLGNTIEQACVLHIKNTVDRNTDLQDLSQLLQLTIASEIHPAVDTLIAKMDEVSAGSADVESLCRSLFPLAEVLKYGNIRKTNQEQIELIFNAIFYRSTLNLSINCMNIDYDGASEMMKLILEFNKMLLMLDHPIYLNDWRNELKSICENEYIHPFILGSCFKLAYEAEIVDKHETAQAFALALSVGNDVEYSVYWLEGFLKDAAVILLLDETIWQIVFNWVDSLDDAHFLGLLPILRRTFGLYAKVEKEKLAQKVTLGKQSKVRENQAKVSLEFSEDLALPIIHTFSKLIGIHK